jgi:deoxyribodipyrimidine photo-lyase
MTIKYENGLFIFRRDFRVIDNVGLNLANSICKRIYPIFIFTPEQVTGANKFKSDNAVQFMIESLQDLSSQISKMGGHLMCFYGHNNTIVSNLIKELDINVVCFNADYSPYAIQREMGIINICDKMGIDVEYGHDYYLHPPGTILNIQGNPYQKFTPFYNVASKKKVEPPASLRKINFSTTNKHLANSISLIDALKRFLNKNINKNILVHGGRTEAIKQMREAGKNIKFYSKTHNELSKPTSQLSAYIKFGCISIREVYKIFRAKHDFIRQLFWRDFYEGILYSFPQVLGNALKPKYNKIKWKHNSNWFQLWTKGETGFPVVDAGMRQMNQTGYMHNRARLIVSSFLIKTLLISWEEGEKRLQDFSVTLKH